MERWIPPEGMVARMLHFDFRDGGSYRMRLTHLDPGANHGKTTEDSDEVEVQLVQVVYGEKIEQEVTFESEDPTFAGAMRMVWTFESAVGGTVVTVRAEGVPLAIRQEDHEAAMKSTLENLAAFVIATT